MAFPRLLSSCVAIGLGLAPFACAQDSPGAPFSIGAPLAGAQWQLNGFAQFRLTAPGARGLQMPLAQYSLSIVPKGQTSPAVFVQGGATTMGGSQAFLLESWAAHDIVPGWRAQAGRFLVPFTRQFITSPTNLLFADISAADAAFNSPYAWGSLVTRTSARATWTAGLISSPTALDALGLTGPHGRPGAVGRVEVNVLAPYGYLESDPGNPETPQLSIGAAGLYNSAALPSALQNVENGDRVATGTADFGLRYRRFAAQGALYLRRNRRVGGSQDWGSYCQAGFYVVPKRLEAAARLGNVSLGELRNAAAAGDIREKTLGLNWYLREHFLKLQSDYTWSQVRPFDGLRSSARQFRLQAQFSF